MAKPQDLPAGESQMYVGLIFNFITYVVALIAISSFGEAVMHAVIDIACTAFFLYIALSLTKRLARLHQALGAIYGAGAFLNLSAIPILYSATAQIDQNVATVTVFAQFVLLVWSLSLAGHVLRHTFDLSMFSSIGIAVLYYVLITSILGAVFPPEQAVVDPTGLINNLQPPKLALQQAIGLNGLSGESSIF